MLKELAVSSLIILVIGCASKPTPPKEITADGALRPAGTPEIYDDMNYAGLAESIEDHLAYLKNKPAALQFGPKLIATSQYVQALTKLKEELKTPEKVPAAIKELFDCFEVQGDGRWGEAFMTSYFDPVIKASRKPTAEHSRPIYLSPQGMVLIRLDEFRETFPHWSLLAPQEQKSTESLARGRIYRKGGVDYVVPFYSRRELDTLGLMRDPKLEIAYADPIDVFIMQIQGSGTLQFEDGHKERIGYYSQNGHPYVPIGKFLKDKIPADQMSMKAIDRVLRTMPKEEAQAIMDMNPSYVFFKRIKTAPVTTIGTVVRPGRTIATDKRYFPKGTLALLEFNKPVFTSSTDEQPTSWAPAKRIVVDQDTGGAIRGTGRLDLYWGQGAEAAQSAGVMKQWGKLCYLVPKQ